MSFSSNEKQEPVAFNKLLPTQNQLEGLQSDLTYEISRDVVSSKKTATHLPKL